MLVYPCVCAFVTLDQPAALQTNSQQSNRPIHSSPVRLESQPGLSRLIPSKVRSERMTTF